MKKKYFIVSVLFLFIIHINVNAETYYGDYYLVDNVSNIESDEYLVEETKLFNTYVEIYEDLGYLYENEEYIKDENDFIEEIIVLDEYVENSEEYIDIGIGNNKITEVYLRNIINKTKLNEIEIYYKDELLDFECFLNYVQDINNLFDKDINTYMYSLNSRCFLRFILEMEYNINDIKIILYTPKDTNTNLSVTVDNKVLYPISLKGDKHIIAFNNDSDETIYSYKTKIKKYRYSNISKIPTNNYVEFGDNLILDDYIINNKYYKRDKLVLKDIIIDNKDFNINDFIEYSSNEVISECNIDYNINGEYYCNFILNDININKKVIVDVKEDNIVDEEVIDETIDNEVIKDPVLNNDFIESEVKESNSIEYNYNNIGNIEEIEIKDVEDIDVIEETTKINKDILSTNINNKNNKYIGVIKYIFIILIVLVEVLLFIKKKKNKTNVENI